MFHSHTKQLAKRPCKPCKTFSLWPVSGPTFELGTSRYEGGLLTTCLLAVCVEWDNGNKRWTRNPAFVLLWSVIPGLRDWESYNKDKWSLNRELEPLSAHTKNVIQVTLRFITAYRFLLRTNLRGCLKNTRLFYITVTTSQACGNRCNVGAPSDENRCNGTKTGGTRACVVTCW